MEHTQVSVQCCKTDSSGYVHYGEEVLVGVVLTDLVM